ncbi:hypothetical protein [Streptomyces sp. NPDC046925]|uniref:hypothetical protein n=1 Tax=Streptomyces sp. NPDC046925 TaxID=3155375 RepID=UPI0034008345
MLYTGFIHSSAYYGYFHLDTFAIGFDTLELALRSLRLVTFPVLIALALMVLGPRLPDLLVSSGLSPRAAARLRSAGHAVARTHLALVAAGVVLMLLWRFIQPFGWLPPLLVAGGLLLGQSGPQRRVRSGTNPLWGRAIPITVAALFLMWAVALVAGQLGRQDARAEADRVARRVSVIVVSEDRLSIAPGPAAPRAEDLGKGNHYRYRYTGLRLLVERNNRYYLLTLGWRHDRDPTYVVEDDDSVRIELHPGTRRR